MYFEAESNRKKYEVNVNETKEFWKVSLRQKDKNWIHYEIPKKDYQNFDDTVSFLFKNSSYLVDVVGSGTEYTVYTRGAFRTVRIYNEEKLLHESLKKGGGFSRGQNLNSGMPGKIVEILVKKGDIVEEDQSLVIMEAMKMENEMRADARVKVKDIHVKQGDNVDSGALLISFEPVPEEAT